MSTSKFLSPVEIKFDNYHTIYKFDSVISYCIKKGIPLVVRSLISEKLLSNWQNFDFLSNKIGDISLPIESYDNTFYDIRKSQIIYLTFREYLNYLKLPFKERKLYLAEVELFNRNKSSCLLKSLNADIDNYQIYLDKFLCERVLFLGYESVTQMHYHTKREALLNQISGIKRIFLYPPNNDLFYQMKPYSWYHPQLNWSQHVFEAKNASEFKLLSENFSFDDGIEVVLYPGDSLYIPIYWWHIVFSEKINLAFTDFFSVSMKKNYLSFIGFRSLNHFPYFYNFLKKMPKYLKVFNQFE